MNKKEVDKIINEAKGIIKENQMYTIKKFNLYELKEGKTDVYLSGITGYTRQYLSEIFNGKRNIDRKTVEKILVPIFAESVKLKEKYERFGMDTMIQHFFKKM